MIENNNNNNNNSNNNELSGPPIEDYRHYSSKAYFTYLPNQTQFQQGYLGVQPSRICGFFHLQYSDKKPLRVERIELIFKGKVSVKWDIRRGSESRTFRKSNKFIRFEKQLWSSSAKGDFEPITKLDLPFEFKIPEVAPTSIPFIEAEYTTNGSINYSIKAKIHRKSVMKRSSYKIVEVWIFLNRYVLLPPIPNYEILPMIKKAEMFECQVTFEKTIFDINSGVINVPINVKLLDMRVTVKNVILKLKQFTRLKIENLAKINSKYVAYHEIPGNQLFANPGSDEFVTQMQIDLSKCKNSKSFIEKVGHKVGILRCSSSTMFIDIYHKVKVVINLGNATLPSVEFEKEIKICNLVPSYDVNNIGLENPEQNARNTQVEQVDQIRWEELSGDELPEYH